MKAEVKTTDKLTSCKVYSLFNASGKIEEIKPVEKLPLYCKVYIYGFGMNESQGAIISEPNENGVYKVVKISDYNQGFDTLDKYSRPHSQKFGIGIYYDDNFETWPEKTVKKYIELAKIAEAKRKDEAEAKANADKEEREALPLIYPHLTRNPKDDHTITKQNLIAELKKNFPGIKFSVRKEHYDTYNVSWQNGPSYDEVIKITGKFEDHENDFTGDFRDYAPSNFNRVFGGFKYVFEDRAFSSEIHDLEAEYLKTRPADEYDARNDFYRICRKASFPAGAKNFKIERTEITCGIIEDFYKITYEVDQAPAIIEAISGSSLFLVDYSDKALALFGDTKPIKDTLKEMGGRFNPALNHNGIKEAGWVFSKSKRELLNSIVM